MGRINGMNRVLVTGSQGFVGKKLIKRLLKYDIEIVEFNINEGRDILDSYSFSDLESVDIVVHLAAKTYIPDAFDRPDEMYRTNILGTLNVLEYCRLKSVKKIIYMSSYVYGLPEYLPIDEKHVTNIQNPYGRSKLIGEMLCMGYFNDYGIGLVIMRPFNIYGPGQSERFLIPTIIRKTLNDDIILEAKDLFPKRDFVFVDDVVNAIVFAMLSFEKKKPEIFNVGYGKSYSVEDIVNKIQYIAGTHKKVVCTNQTRKSEISDCVADISKIKKYFDWKPRFSIDEGLKQTILYYKKNV